MPTDLPALFDLLKGHLLHNKQLAPLPRTNLPLADPRWVAAVLASLKTHGFTFRFFTPSEEVALPGVDGYCHWFKRDATGAQVPDRGLALSRRANSLDAFAVAAHELGHVYTLTPEAVSINSNTPNPTATPFYARGEVLAEATAFLCAATVAPDHLPLLVRRSVTYLRNYPVPPEVWAERDLVLDAAFTILTDAAERLEMIR